MITDVVAAQPRATLPPVILDKQAPGDLDSDLRERRRGRALTSRASTTSTARIRAVAEHRHARAIRRHACRAAPGALHPHREGRLAARRRRARHRQRRLRRHRLHARDPRLRAHRAGRLGEDQSAGERRLPVQHPRCRMAAASRPCHSELAAGAPRRSARVQRLPSARHAAESALAWPRGALHAP